MGVLYIIFAPLRRSSVRYYIFADHCMKISKLSSVTRRSRLLPVGILYAATNTMVEKHSSCVS